MTQQQNKDMSQYFYRASAADFMKIPGSPVAYWLSSTVIASFTKEKLLGEIADLKQGMSTTDADRFVRNWQELSLSKIGFKYGSASEGNNSGKDWFPFNKGGRFRKWYGNNEQIVNYESDGKVLLSLVSRKYPNISDPEFVIKNRKRYFFESVTYTAISSSKLGVRLMPRGFIFSIAGPVIQSNVVKNEVILGLLLSPVAKSIVSALSPTLNFQAVDLEKIPVDQSLYGNGRNSYKVEKIVNRLVQIANLDWDSYEISWDFTRFPLLDTHFYQSPLVENYKSVRAHWQEMSTEMLRLEEENNCLFIDIYGLQDELAPDVELEDVTLTCNPHYRYGGNRSEEELETLLQCDTLKELISYAIGCMMGRYSIDKPGLILASQGETLQDYLNQIPSPRFMPDDDAILPLTDQEWFPDDATNRFREFVRVVWGDEHLQENLDFVAESLCLHAIKPKRGETALDTIRRYLSTQFFKDHLKTYKKRPIYWLFSSGKQKAFECLVYLHRYNEGTLARMRTEYVIPLTAKMAAYAQKLEKDKEASNSAAEVKRLEKEIEKLHKQQAELAEFDEKLRHYADQRISLDLDDGVKVNYGKFGDLLAEVKAITGEAPEALV